MASGFSKHILPSWWSKLPCQNESTAKPPHILLHISPCYVAYIKNKQQLVCSDPGSICCHCFHVLSFSFLSVSMCLLCISCRLVGTGSVFLFCICTLCWDTHPHWMVDLHRSGQLVLPEMHVARTSMRLGWSETAEWIQLHPLMKFWDLCKISVCSHLCPALELSQSHSCSSCWIFWLLRVLVQSREDCGGQAVHRSVLCCRTRALKVSSAKIYYTCWACKLKRLNLVSWSRLSVELPVSKLTITRNKLK